MDIPVKRDPEADRLRQTTRDLVALTGLPAIWHELPPAGVIDSLCAVLLRILDLDLAYVRLSDREELGETEAARTRQAGAGTEFLPALRALAEQGAAPGAPAIVADPGGGPPFGASVVRFGILGEIGTIVAASRRPGFPSENDRLLLDVGANQATLVLQRHHAERALKRSELRFLDLADAAPAMLWVTEPDGSCSFLSRGWYDFTGQTEEEGLGIGWTATIHPDDRAAATLAFHDANARKAEFSLEHRVLHVDGSYRWVIDTGRPRFAPGGEFLGFVGNVLDISDRKQTEQALHDTRELLSAVFEALPVGVAVSDQQGNVLFSNEEMRQYLPTMRLPSLDDARHQRWRAFHDDGTPCSREHFAGIRALRGERVVPGIEALYTDDDDTEIWTQVAAVPLKDGRGGVKGQVSIVTNIDTFKRTEAALRLAEADQRALFDEVARSNRNLSEFLAVLAHELRNPLAPILSGLEIMRMRADSLETVSNVRGIIERQVRQLSHLINDLLDIARVTNGKVDLKKETIDLKAIVANAVETSLPLIEKGRHAFSMTLHDAPLPVHADATRIAQVVGNLLTNAAKYTPPGGQIALHVGRDGAEALISVTDNGIGIPAEALESVFEMFSQVGRNMHHSQGGLGIGLALVRQLVSLHDGTVAASSAGAGKGSTFSVRLPIDAAGVDAGPAGGAPGASAGAGKSLRILVTDDNVDAATTLASLLEMQGHDVRTAYDGQQALQLAAHFHPEVVFLDIGMPGMSGYEVVHRLRKMEGPVRATIVAVSGWGAEDDLARSREAGFDLHFTKPVAPARLNQFLASLS